MTAVDAGVFHKLNGSYPFLGNLKGVISSLSPASTVSWRKDLTLGSFCSIFSVEIDGAIKYFMLIGLSIERTVLMRK